MTVPQQRGGAQPPADSTVLGMVLDGVRDVKDSVTRLQDDMARRFDGLDSKYMRSSEIMQRAEDSLRDRTSIRQALAEAKAHHEAEIARLAATIETVEAKRVTDRRYAVTTLIATIALLLTMVGTIIALSPH